MDLVVRGGTVVTAAGATTADVGVENGKVVALGSHIPKGKEEIDASGAYIFPGGVDVHTHLNRVRGPRPTGGGAPRIPADDFRYGTRAAAAGGVTTLCDFAPQDEGGSLRAALDESRAFNASKAYIDYAFHIMVSDPTPEAIAEVPGLVADGVPSFKYFQMRPNFLSRASDYLQLMQAVGDASGVVMVHCENAALVSYYQNALLNDGHPQLKYYPASRPRDVEISGTEMAVRMAGATGAATYIVHLSCEGALAETRAARARGARVYVETRPIYLYLTEERFDQDDREAAKYVGIPPLRDAHDVNVMWRALQNDDINVVATDHMSYKMADKYRAGDTFAMVPPGMSNLQTLMPMLYSEGVGKGRISLERFVELIATTPAKLFGLYPRKGTIAIGSDADLCIFDPEKRFTVRANAMESASDFEVFEGWEIKGWPTVTISRGEVIYRDGKLTAKDGRGQFLSRGVHRGL